MRSLYVKKLEIAGLVLVVAMTLSAAPSRAHTACNSNKTFVPKWGCVLKTEVAKAKKYCLALKPPTRDFRECLCQDGKQIGACGN